MPETVLNVPTVHEDHLGNIYPARLRAIDLTDGQAFIEYFSLTLCKWVTGWRPLASLWF